ncbi:MULTISPECIES: PH domain-containing protein [Streptomyces]|uniref:PH domain-containing protein n=1 Tax=Streptomyces rhizosphaericola TaxID=2564098 RepID=A0ABY2PJ63_9ACTN|nr:PH domain-containing protein [Streptomyces sp. S8]TGZ11120.1 hypothetical protein E5Z02_06415 [Streptomyces rhizosphaericola]
MRVRKRRTAWALGYFLMGVACLLVAGVMAAGADRPVHLIPVVIVGVPGALLTLRAPRLGVCYGPAGVRYSGLFGTRTHAWADIREVRVAVLPGTVYSSDVPELVLASGGTDQLLMLGGHSWGRTRNRRITRLVADLEAARAAAS